MFKQFQSKVQGLIGNQCPETGVRTGKATLTSMDKASPLRLPLARAAPWSLTMLPLIAGPLARPSQGNNSIKRHRRT